MNPLPSSLSKKDTVCSYCGVSYLIMHEVEKYKAEITDLRKQLSILQRKDAASQLTERSSNTQVKAVTEMNAELNHLLAASKVELLEAREKKAFVEKENTRLQLQLREAQIVGAKVLQQQETLKEQIKLVKEDAALQVASFQKLLEDTQEQVGLVLRQNAICFKGELQKRRDVELELQQSRDYSQQLQGDLDQLQQFLNQKETQIKQQTEVQEAQNTLLQTLRSQIQQQEREMRESADQISLLQTDISGLQIEVKRLQEIIAQKDLQIQRLSQEGSNGSEEISRLKELLGQKEVELKSLQDQISQLQAKAKRNQEETEAALKAQVLRNDRDVQKLLKQVEDLKLRETELQNQLNDAQNDAAAARGAEGRLERALQQKDAEMEKLRGDLIQQKQSYEEQTRNLTDQVEKKRKESELLQGSNQDLQRQQKELFERYLKLQSHFEELQRAQTTPEELSALRKRLGILEEELEKERRLREGVEKELQQQQKALVLSDQRGLSYKEQAEALRNELEALKAQMNTKNADENPPRMEEKNAEIQRLKAQLLKLQQTVLHECRERNELMRIVKDLRGRVQ